MTCYVHFVISNLPISDDRLLEFQRETSRDPALEKLREYKENGWLRKKKDVHSPVHPFYKYRDEITAANGLLLRNERLIVPIAMRQEMRTKIHAGHLGIEKFKARAREVLFWPGISTEITDMIGNCSICLEYRNKQQKEYFISREILDQPWIKYGVDLFQT